MCYLCTFFGKQVQQIGNAVFFRYQCHSARKLLIYKELTAVLEFQAIRPKPVFMRVWRGPRQDINKVIHRKAE
jgi:hypothetical protein